MHARCVSWERWWWWCVVVVKVLRARKEPAPSPLASTQVLQTLANVDDAHPFAEGVCQSALFLRELLCCWEERTMHSPAMHRCACVPV